MDALPVRADVSTKESIDKIEVKQLLAENKMLAIKNVDLPELKVDIIEKKTSTEVKNTGLAMLGLSWRASKGDDEVKEKSTLLKIASYGVNQIGKLAGKKINLEKKYDPKTDKTRVAFNSLGFGFSTPVK
jgi:thiamine biosynthesis protein ThiC